MIKYNISQQSEAWFEARAGRVTGTRFKELVSGQSTKGYKDLVNSIAAEIITHKIEESYTNAIMERGIEMEPFARKEYENLMDVGVEEVGFIIPDEGHKYHEWIGISPDGIPWDGVSPNRITRGLVEIKCPLMKTHIGYIEGNKLPSEYKYQVQGQLFVTGLPYCDFVSYYPDMKLFIIRVVPDLELFARFEERLDELITDVKAKLRIYNQYTMDKDYSIIKLDQL